MHFKQCKNRCSLRPLPKLVTHFVNFQIQEERAVREAGENSLPARGLVHHFTFFLSLCHFFRSSDLYFSYLSCFNLPGDGTSARKKIHDSSLKTLERSTGITTCTLSLTSVISRDDHQARSRISSFEPLKRLSSACSIFPIISRHFGPGVGMK